MFVLIVCPLFVEDVLRLVGDFDHVISGGVGDETALIDELDKGETGVFL